jgi:hypothetical protein
MEIIWGAGGGGRALPTTLFHANIWSNSLPCGTKYLSRDQMPHCWEQNICQNIDQVICKLLAIPLLNTSKHFEKFVKNLITSCF